MGKTQAEIQREYRARKKAKEGEAYLQKERDRVKKYYVPIHERSKKEQNERRKKVNRWVRIHRQKKRVIQENSDEASGSNTGQDPENQNDTNDDNESEISSQVVSSKTSEKLVVKLKQCDPKSRTRTRVSRATAKSRREIEKLKIQNVNLQRKYKTAAKRYERLQKKVSNFPPPKHITENNCLEDNIDITPRKRTACELRKEGLTPRKIPRKVFDKLVLANAVAEEIKDAWKGNGQKGKKIIARVISGQIINKYRFKTKLSSLTGIKRSGFSPYTKRCDKLPEIQKRIKERNEIKRKVVEFLERDDNSRVMPGKADKIRTEQGNVQTRYLNDSMSNLHLKFTSESMTKISRATFCRVRPKYIRLTKFICRNKCLCQKHQNMALMLKSAKSAGMGVPLSPDDYARKLTDLNPQELLSDVKNSEISYQQWAKVDLPDGKKRTKIVEKEITKEAFSEKFLQMSADFTDHVDRVHCQYKAIKDLKENLPLGHVIVQMDFSENYSCVSAEEVQSAYWNANSVTLHPTVIYYKTAEGKLDHKNYMFVSDDNGHNIGAVYTFMKYLVPDIISNFESVKHIHYWTDSPSSQYRNKTAFFLISKHMELFSVSATWDYFEAGHGKGPCDGLGGAAKRMADLSVKQGKATIQDAMEFFNWGQTYQKSAKYIYISGDECDLSRAEITEINKGLVPVSGTLQVHSVAPISIGKVKTSVTSCYCEQCLSGNKTHDGYSEHNLVRKKSIKESGNIHTSTCQNLNEVENMKDAEDNEASSEKVSKENVYKAEEWVSAKFDQDWFIGKILETDDQEGDCKITFMRQTKCKDAAKSTFKWPVPIDELWVKFDDIICKISPPRAMGRSGRSYTISKACFDKIIAAL